MASPFTKIQKAFEKRLKLMTPLPPVAWTNTKYKPIEGTTWIRLTVLPAPAELDILAGSEMHEGFCQIDVFTPLDKGSSEFNTLCDRIYDWFKSTETLQEDGLDVYLRNISQSTQRRDEAWNSGYVEIYYKCYT